MEKAFNECMAGMEVSARTFSIKIKSRFHLAGSTQIYMNDVENLAQNIYKKKCSDRIIEL